MVRSSARNDHPPGVFRSDPGLLPASPSGGLVAILLTVTLVSPVPAGQAVEGQDLEWPLADVLQQIYTLNQVQILAAQLALIRTRDSQVYRYAERLWRDHRQGERAVTDLAQRYRINLLPPPGSRSDLDQGTAVRSSGGHASSGAGSSGPRPDPDLDLMLRGLRRSSDADFDRTYLAAVARGHRQLVDIMDRAVATRHQPLSVQAAIGDMLPIVNQHLQLARVLTGSVP